MKKLLLGTITLLTAANLSAQLSVDISQSPQQLVLNSLLGQGISASNITFNGTALDSADVQLGSFAANGNDLGMYSGVMMGTEALTIFVSYDYTQLTTNITNDSDLLLLSNPTCQNFNNMAILEFDFIPAGDTMIFDYVFGSEEYGSFTCTQYNDAFGFFLSGPGINGIYSNNAINIANIPGTSTPVAINTVNSGIADGDATECENANPNWLSDTVYFNREIYDFSDSTKVRLNGLTDILSAIYYGLVIGETYHIKMAIGDACDASVNSAVFFNGSSFRTMGGATSVSENNKKEIGISSLGNNGVFQINNTNGQLVETVVYNLVGERVFQKSSTNSMLDLSRLSNSVYIAQLRVGNKTISKKLVIN
jgi:Secretion system C-terminal sorting domain